MTQVSPSLLITALEAAGEITRLRLLALLSEAEVTVSDAAQMQQVTLINAALQPETSYIYVWQLLLTAESNKRRAATAMNERSRSPNSTRTH